MQALSSITAKEEGKALYDALGPNVSDLIQSYTPITVDIPFLNDVLQWYTYEDDVASSYYARDVLRDAIPKFKDANYRPVAAFPDVNIMVQSLAFYRSRGYEIKESEDFINMVVNHPITTEVGRLRLHATVLNVETKETENDRLNITFSQVGFIYNIENWTANKTQPQNRGPTRGIYTQDVLSLVFYLIKESRQFGRPNIRSINVDRVEYEISARWGPILNMYTTINIEN